MPEYLTFFDGNTRLRSTHLDDLSFVSSLEFKENLNKSFFYRTHSLWNALPYEIREIGSLAAFKSRLIKHLWDSTISNNSISNNSYLEDFELFEPD